MITTIHNGSKLETTKISIYSRIALKNKIYYIHTQEYHKTMKVFFKKIYSYTQIQHNMNESHKRKQRKYTT